MCIQQKATPWATQAIKGTCRVVTLRRPHQSELSRQHKTVPRTLVLPRRLMLMGPFVDTPNQLIHSDSITKIRKRKLVMDSETCCHRKESRRNNGLRETDQLPCLPGQMPREKTANSNKWMVMMNADIENVMDGCLLDRVMSLRVTSPSLSRARGGSERVELLRYMTHRVFDPACPRFSLLTIRSCGRDIRRSMCAIQGTGRLDSPVITIFFMEDGGGLPGVHRDGFFISLRYALGAYEEEGRVPRQPSGQYRYRAAYRLLHWTLRTRETVECGVRFLRLALGASSLADPCLCSRF